MCGLVARLAAVIRVEAVWLCTEPMDMRAGTDTTLARVVQVFGAARPHHAYLFANKRSTRLKVLVHEERTSVARAMPVGSMRNSATADAPRATVRMALPPKRVIVGVRVTSMLAVRLVAWVADPG